MKPKLLEGAKEITIDEALKKAAAFLERGAVSLNTA
jgi:hypothetical protein